MAKFSLVAVGDWTFVERRNRRRTTVSQSPPKLGSPKGYSGNTKRLNSIVVTPAYNGFNDIYSDDLFPSLPGINPPAFTCEIEKSVESEAQENGLLLPVEDQESNSNMQSPSVSNVS